jgi:hypothetical protein
MRKFRWVLAQLAVIAAVTTTVSTAQPIYRAPDAGAYTGPASLPPALQAAKALFISNAGADSGLFPQPFSGDQDRAYTQFYTQLKASGKYQLVGDPSEADLVLELQLTAPNGPSRGSKQNGASDPVPMFRLVIYDRKTHYILWALTESIDVALLQKTHDRNFDQALSNLVGDFEALTGKLPATGSGPPPAPGANH